MQSQPSHVIESERFAEVLESCRRFLLALASAEVPRRLLPKAGVSDLVQETLVAGYLGRHQFRGRTVGELRGWLRRILLNELASFARRYTGPTRNVAREVGVAAADPPAVADGSLDAMVHDEQLSAASAAVERLSGDGREVLRLRLEHGLGFREIANRLGRTEESARKLFARTLESLRSTRPGAAA